MPMIDRWTPRSGQLVAGVLDNAQALSGLGVVWPIVAVRRGWAPACWGPWGCPLLPHVGRAGGLGGVA